jgi:hypothetical protein
MHRLQRDPWRHNGCSGRFTDAAYTNYLVTNNLVLVPVYGCLDDERAKLIIAEHFPGRRVVGIPTLTLTEEGGAIHCVTHHARIPEGVGPMCPPSPCTVRVQCPEFGHLFDWESFQAGWRGWKGGAHGAHDPLTLITRGRI